MRKQSRQMSAAWAVEVLRKAPFVTVAFMAEGCSPYCLPLSLAMKDESTWYFHCALEGRKVSAIRRNPEVCLSAVLRSTPTIGPKDGSFSLQYKSAVAFGKAYIVSDEDERREALRLITGRYFPDEMQRFEANYERSKERTMVVRIDLSLPPTGKRKEYDENGEERCWQR